MAEEEEDTQRSTNDVFPHDRGILNERFFFLTVSNTLSSSPPAKRRVPAVCGRVSDRPRGGGRQVHGRGVVADAADAQ